MDSIDVLDLVNQERNKFGIREYDFHRYRVHCTNKLKNLRKSIELQQVNHKTRKFEKRPFDLGAIPKNQHLHLKYFLISLFEVEHSWAASREIREQIQVVLKKNRQQLSSNQSYFTGVSRLRKHSQNRLKKAIQHSDQLVDLCNLPSNTLALETLAQVYVHRHYMKGLFNFELARWESSFDHFVVSFVILKALGNSSSSIETVDHKKRVIFYQSMDELCPMIRYCAYQIGIDSTEIDKVSQERFDQTGFAQQVIKETHWNQIKSFIDSSQEFDQPVVELSFIKKLISIRNPELIDLITNVKRADQILLSNHDIHSMLNFTLAEQNQTKNLNKKQRRKLFLQSKKPKLSNAKNLRISSTVGFDRALAIYIDAENSLQALIESNNRAIESNSRIQRFDEQSKLLSTIHEIVGFRLLSTRVQRDLVLIEKIENKLIKQEVQIEDRIKKNLKNYQNISKLVNISKNKHKNSFNFNSKVLGIELIKSLLIKRRQAKVFPSLLKLIEDILFNLERIKQLNLIEDDHLLSLKIESKFCFFKAYRCWIQSKSYLLIDKFLESYILQQKSYFYFRQTATSIEEAGQEEEEENKAEDEDTKEKTDLNLNFLKFDETKLKFLGEEFQEKLKREITKEWIANKGSRDDSMMSETENLERAETELKNLSLTEHKEFQDKFDGINTTVFDVAFNYVTQFEWDKLVDGHPQTHPSSSQPKIQKDFLITSSNTTDIPQVPTPPAPAPAKKSSGLWSFFTRS